MGRIKDIRMDQECDEYEACGEDVSDVFQRIYPVKLQVDGYEVNHYYDDEYPVYEILDDDGNVLERAHSTSEMHEFTSMAKDEERLDIY